MDSIRRNISLKALAFIVGLVLASLIACEKDTDVQPTATFSAPEQGDVVNKTDGLVGYYYTSDAFWYNDTIQGTEFPMGASFATYYNDSVTESSVELVAWSGDYWMIYSDEIILTADSFYFTSNTGYQLEVEYSVISGFVDVDSLYGTWVFRSGESGSTVAVSRLKLHNAN